MRAFSLYQPQRRNARLLAKLLAWLIRIGLHRLVLGTIEVSDTGGRTSRGGPNAKPGSVGILFGSPEHRVKRAISTYEAAGRWEVAKIAFGSEGKEVIEREAKVLAGIAGRVPGGPQLLGFRSEGDISLLWLPCYEGKSIRMGDAIAEQDAVRLLSSWLGERTGVPISQFPDWGPIVRALEEHPRGGEVIERLSTEQLRPAVRHGDFSRWNLLRLESGKLLALDWEWGSAEGIPGVDLVHYFAQDVRLVKRMPVRKALESVRNSLNRTECRDYLRASGWSERIDDLIIAAFALTVGAKQQQNEIMLKCMLEREGDEIPKPTFADGQSLQG
jgi:hypothetical protein